VPPTGSGMRRWRADIGLLSRWCGSGAPAIIAGDLNASLDHSVLRAAMGGCSDAAAQHGAGLVGTWPSWAPRWLGPQIDHVLVTAGIQTERLDILDLPGSDHRAVLAQLTVP
jgi:endonuclease/exonuclease/phosphatase (EEP) superfamily protein YafD